MSASGRAAIPSYARFRPQSLILPVYLPTLLLSIGLGAVLPVIPLFAKELGAGVGMAGIVFGIRGIGTMLTDLPAGFLTSRFGDKAAVVAGASGCAMAALLAGFSTGVASLSFSVLALGSGLAVWGLARLAYMTDMVRPEHRGRALSLSGGTSRIGVFIGPIAGGALGKAYGLEAAFFFQAGCCALAAALLALCVRGVARGEDVGPERFMTGFGVVLASHGRRLVGTGAVSVSLQLARNARHLLITLWGDAIGLDVAEIGVVVGLSSGLDMLLFYPAGLVMDRRGRKWTGVPALLILSTSLALIPATTDFLSLLAVALLAGLGNGLSSGFVMTLGADQAPLTGRGEFLGVWRLLGDVGTAAGPLVVGAAAQVSTLGTASLLTAGLGLAGAVVLAFFVEETLVRDG